LAIIAFDNASLVGTYGVAVTGSGGLAPFAAVGSLTFHRDGVLSASWRENRPGSSFGGRTVIEAAWRGTCEVRADGTGTATSAESGQPDLMFAVRRAPAAAAGAPLADELAIVFRDLDVASGSLKIAVATRLPEGAAFGTGSLRGRYVGFARGEGGQTPAAGCGIVTYDGQGGFSESNFSNIQGGSFKERRFITGTDQGTYSVDADGTGTVASGGVVIAITRAKLTEGIAIAEEYAFFVRDLVPATGALFTGTTKRLSD
jgi:hypothetical protein